MGEKWKLLMLRLSSCRRDLGIVLTLLISVSVTFDCMLRDMEHMRELQLSTYLNVPIVRQCALTASYPRICIIFLEVMSMHALLYWLAFIQDYDTFADVFGRIARASFTVCAVGQSWHGSFEITVGRFQPIASYSAGRQVCF